MRGDPARDAEHLASLQLCGLSPAARTSASAGAGGAGAARERPGRCRRSKGRGGGGRTKQSHACLTAGLKQTHCWTMFFFFQYPQCLETLHQSIGVFLGCIQMLFYTTSRTLNEHHLIAPLFVLAQYESATSRAAGMQTLHSCTAPWNKGYIKHAT